MSDTGAMALQRVNRRTWAYGTVGGSLALLLLASVARGQGCPCARRDLAGIVKQADVIFVGTPLAATTDSTVIGRPPAQAVQTRLMFQVTTVLKGSTSRSTAVATPAGPCGFGFAVGTEYLVAGTKQGGGVVTDACQGNVSGRGAIQARAAAIRDLVSPKAKPPAPSVAP
jgi:hypothetical protein